MASTRKFHFLWWNVHDFSHYTPARASQVRWPRTPADYETKCRAIDAVLREVEKQRGPLPLLAFCEITRQAALDLRDRLYPGYRVFSLDLDADRPSFETAFLYDPRWAFQEPELIMEPVASEGTRAMAVLDLSSKQHQIRFIACHWKSRMDPRSSLDRDRSAAYLNQSVYDFMREPSAPQSRHVVIVGDLNDEPFDHLEDTLHASRSHTRARAPAHHTDRRSKRLHLYNCGWRLLGERRPHDGSRPVQPGPAGTYYWAEQKTWHTFDQIIVSGSLLTDGGPQLDETQVEVFVSPSNVGKDGLPKPGVSDHLPVLGTILLGKESSWVASKTR